MSIQFILGPACSGKSEYLKNLFIKEAVENRGTKYLFIVPDQYTLQTQKDMIKRHPDRAFSNLEVLNFSRLSHRILEEIGGEEIPVLDDTGKSLIIRHVAESVKDELKVFGGRIDRIGFMTEVKSAVSEFMQYGIKPDAVNELAEFASSRPALSCKLQDLACLYRAFMEYKGLNFRTREETLEVVQEGIYKSALIRGAVICFDGFTGFTPIQERVIGELLKYADRIYMSLDMEEGMDPYHIEGEQELFYLSKKTISNMKKLADAALVSEEPPVCLKRRPREKELSHLEAGLFRYPYSGYEGSPENIRIYQAQRVRDEITDTFQRIKDLTDNEGYRYCDIAVVVGNLSGYADDIKEISQDFGVPVYMDYSRSVLMLPFIEAIRSAYEVCEENFAPEAVIRHIRCGFGPLNAEECDELENFLLRTGIKGRSAYNRYWDVACTKEAEETQEQKERRLKKAERLNLYRTKIVEHFSYLGSTEATAEEHSRALYEFFKHIQAHERLDKMADHFKECGDYARFLEYSQLFSKICDLLDQIVLLIGDEKLKREEYSQILEAGLGEIKLGIIPQEMDRVQIGDIERTRLSDIKALFLLGANDGSIPSGISCGGIISDIDREFLKKSDFALAPTPRDQMFIQRLYLYMNLSKPSEKLYVSFAQMDIEGKSIRKSYLIGMLLNLFPGMKIEESSSTHRAAGRTMPAGRHMIRMELAAYMREYALGRLSEEEKEYMRDLADSMIEHGFDEVYGQIVDSSFMEFSNESIAGEIAAKLYGAAMRISISRIEKYAACAYAHFLQYGMGLKEREEFSFERNNMGDVFHLALKQFADRLEEENVSWDEYTQEQSDKWVDEILTGIAATYKETIMLSSNRQAAMTERMRRILKHTVNNISYQIAQGSFVPSQFEYGFNSDSKLNIDGKDVRMTVNGIIDRMDICKDEESGDEYIRIVDYKTGSRDFDLAAFYYGLSLQLTVYLDQAIKQRREYHLRRGESISVNPGGMLYQKIHDPYVKVTSDMTEEKIADARRKGMKLTGLLPDDSRALTLNDSRLEGQKGKSDFLPVDYKKDGGLSVDSKVLGSSDFGTILAFSGIRLEELAKEIYLGNISVQPKCTKKTKLPCEYCAFKEICPIDSGIPGYESTKLDEAGADEMLADMREKI